MLMACGSNGTREKNDDPDIDSFLEMKSPEELEEFYEALLNAFCQQNYNDNLPGTFIQGSIKVTGTSEKDTHTDEVIGTHSFKANGYCLGRKFDDKKFVATVTRDGDGLFHINFSRRIVNCVTGKEGDWRYTGDLPFEFDQP